MGLFVRRGEQNSIQKLYNVSQGKALLIVGLGNTGSEYDSTRHNLGFSCVDSFAKQQGFSAWQTKKDFRTKLTKLNIGGVQIILIKPTTYMNNSGQAVGAVQKYYRINNKSTLVIHDDLDVAFGQIRIRKGGSSAGNNGIKSLISHIGEDFSRIRIGIKNDLLEKMDSTDFVLAKFSKDENELLPKITREVSAILSEFTTNNQLPQETRNIII